LAQKITEPETIDLNVLAGEIFHDIQLSFEKAGSTIVHWNGGPLKEASDHMVILNPVYLGKLPDEVTSALSQNDPDLLKSTLREKMPEDYPLIARVGKNKMGLEPPMHPHFTNVIFIDNEQGELDDLSYEQRIIFLRSLMAKQGSFKSIIVPYKKSGDGLTYDRLIMSTLEGGHPSVNSEELAQRLLVFGSLTEVGGYEDHPSLTVPLDKWERSEAVKGLINLGKFLGKHNLLSAPVEIDELIKGDRLSKLVIQLINYARQAEGAFMTVDPILGREIGLDQNWLPVVTSSGRFGTLKTNLEAKDMVGVMSVEPESDDVYVFPVKELDQKGPSVEASEFVGPLFNGSLPNIRISQTEGGYVIDPNGELEVPPIRGVIHIHRGYLPPSSEKIISLNADISKFPPVGCGVDLMLQMSQDAMNRAVQLWEMNDREPIAAAFTVPNHGTNMFVFWGQENGVIPTDPFKLLKQEIDDQGLQFVSEVPQV
jgi:hypothetical protein